MGIAMDRPLTYLHASLRFFEPGELHVTRFCADNVLLLVYDGVLRFAEDGAFYEIAAGQYHIQKKNSFQEGVRPSDSPRYLYVHFDGDWAQDGQTLPPDGTFHPGNLLPWMKKLDGIAHGNGSYVEQCAIFYTLLAALHRKETTPADEIAAFLRANYGRRLSLDLLAREFSYSKNHIVNLFRDKFAETPFAYLARLRLTRAEELLRETTKPVETIAYDCGYTDYVNFYKAFVQKHAQPPSVWRAGWCDRNRKNKIDSFS